MELFKTEDGLYHYGIKGQKWGVRRYQNADGSLTDAGKKRIDRRMNMAFSKIPNPYKIERHSKKVMDELNAEYPKNKKLNELRDKYTKETNPKKQSKFYKEYHDESMRFLNSFNDKFAEATLKDLHIEVTEAGKKYVREKYMIEYR